MANDDKQSCNVIYLTTKCNLNCEYCYEKKNRDLIKEHYSISKEHIREFVDEVCDREINSHSINFTIQGGEPLVEFDLLKYLIEYLASDYSNRGISVGVLSNGIFFSKQSNIDKYINEILKIKSPNHSVSADISYDRSGHDRRVFINGKSSRPIVEKALQLFNKNFPGRLRIRYTIHKLNEEPMTVLHDWVSILETYQPNRIITAVFEEETSKENYKLYEAIARSLYERYKVPICNHVCDLCKSCNKELFQDEETLEPRRNYLTPTGKKFLINKTADRFNHFEIK